MHYESSTIFTKLLAAEDITVRFDPKASTASFDLLNRVVTVPVFKEEVAEMVDGFIVHEVGHALYTPLAQAIAEMFSHIHRGVHNIVEDARIERAMKTNFGGCGKLLFKMYEALMEKDFFGIEGKDVNEMNFANRINLKYKVGQYLNIKFSAAEEAVLKKIDALPLDGSEETQIEVYKVCEEVQKLMKQEKKEEEETQDPHQPSVPATSNEESEETQDSPAPSDEEDDSETEESEAAPSDEGEETDEDGDDADSQDSESKDGDDSETEEMESAPSNGDDDIDLDDIEITDQDFETVDNLEENLQNETMSGEAYGFKETSYKELLEKLTNKTKTLDNLSRYDGLSRETLRELERNWEIISPQYFLKQARILAERIDNSGRADNYYMRNWKNDWKEIETYANRVARQLTSEYKMKAQASELKRTRTHKSGVLNMNKLHEAAYNDDIFLANTIVDDGENHGASVLIDMSGSMNGTPLKKVLEKAYSLALFSAQNNIPFRIFGYTTGQILRHVSDTDEVSQAVHRNTKFDCRILEIANNTLGMKELKEAFRLMFRGTRQRFVNLGGTPFDEAMFLLAEPLKTFKVNYNIDKISFTVMSDGQSTGTGVFGWSSCRKLVYKNSSNRSFVLEVSKGGWIPSIAKTNAATTYIKAEVPGITVSYLISADSKDAVDKILGFNSSRASYIPKNDEFSQIWSAVKPEVLASIKKVGSLDKLFIENCYPESRISGQLKNKVKIAAAAMAQEGSLRKAGKMFAKELIDAIA